MGTIPAAVVVQSAAREGRRLAIGVLRLLRLEELAAGDGSEQQGAEDDEPGADDGREEAGPDDGVRGGLRKRERPVEPHEAEADDGDAEPPGATARSARRPISGALTGSGPPAGRSGGYLTRPTSLSTAAIRTFSSLRNPPNASPER